MNNSSGVNTILLVIVIILLVAGGVWWYTTYGPGMPQTEENSTNGLQINVGQTNETP